METVAEFLARGGNVVEVREGEKAEKKPDDFLKNCSCGCEGDYTDHSMRQGERGIF